jgi:DNA-binding CsgD family transcriptional regulator
MGASRSAHPVTSLHLVPVGVGIILVMSAEDPEERATPGPLFGKGALVALFAWGLVVLAFSAGGLADVTRFWWLVLVFGTAAPVALVAVRSWASRRDAVEGARRAERELLGTLRKHGELTLTAAAMLTSLREAEAAGMLERLAREGHLEARVGDEGIAYALRDRDRPTLAGSEITDEDDPIERAPAEALEASLSAREQAVLKLLAAGHTNKEIAQELFIALGTVKAHVASVYRKLDVHSRAEAVSRARDLGLLG